MVMVPLRRDMDDGCVGREICGAFGGGYIIISNAQRSNRTVVCSGMQWLPIARKPITTSEPVLLCWAALKSFVAESRSATRRAT